MGWWWKIARRGRLRIILSCFKNLNKRAFIRMSLCIVHVCTDSMVLVIYTYIGDRYIIIYRLQSIWRKERRKQNKKRWDWQPGWESDGGASVSEPQSRYENLFPILANPCWTLFMHGQTQGLHTRLSSPSAFRGFEACRFPKIRSTALVFGFHRAKGDHASIQ